MQFFSVRSKGKKTDQAIAEKIFSEHGRSIGHSTVPRIWRNYQGTMSVSNHWSNQGRPGALNTEEQDRLVETARNDRLSSARSLRNELNLNASQETANRVIEEGIKSLPSPNKTITHGYPSDTKTFIRS